jgi:hypothetical protein
MYPTLRRYPYQRQQPDLISQMRRLYDIRDVLHLNIKKKVIVCPLPQHAHHSMTPSFSIFVSGNGVQKFHCFGNCQAEGDVIDLVGFLNIPGYQRKNGEHVKQALAILSGGTRINPPKPETTKKPMLPNGLYKKYLPAGEEVIKYAAERFLTPETLRRFHFGQHNSGTITWMTMPTLHGNQLRGIKLRNLNAANKKDRYRNIDGSIDGLFNYNEVNGTTQPVAIVKGEIAAAVLCQNGILACAPTGGEGSYYKHEEHMRVLAFSPQRIVIGDNDIRPDVRDKMQLAALKRKEIFKAAGLYFPPDPFVGIDDFVIAEPEVAIPMIQEWLK